jgi:regulator of replication initiation timing
MEEAEKLSPEMEQLIAENNMLKLEKELLNNLVDSYDRKLTEMTALVGEMTSKLDEANEIIKRFLPPAD